MMLYFRLSERVQLNYTSSLYSTVYPHILNKNKSYHPRHALTRWCLLVHVKLVGHIVGQACLILELWARPCSWQPLARLAVRTTIGARIGHHIHLESRVRRQKKCNEKDEKKKR